MSDPRDNAEAPQPVQVQNPGALLLHPLPWWRRARHLARLGLLVLAAHAVVLVAVESLRPLSYLTLIASVVAILALPRPELRIGWRRGRIEVQAGRHRWSTPAGAIDLDSARCVELPPPGPGAPEPGRGEFKSSAWLGPGRWPAQDRAVFCAARPGPVLLVPVSPTQALVLSGQRGPEVLLEDLRALLANENPRPAGVNPPSP
jgi:hypothetical protein